MLDDFGKRHLACSQIFHDSRVGGIEGQEPVAQGLEEGEGLQVGKGGDKHVATLDLHGVELLDFTGNSAVVQPLLPFGVSLYIAQVNDLGILVLEFV